jgi:hypothetical protein
MSRNHIEWASDSGLYHRVRDSVKVMARGKGKWGDRAKYVFQRMQPIRETDFPDHLAAGMAIIKALHEASVARYPVSTLLVPSMLSPAQRDLLSDVLFTLYEEMTIARARLP